MIIDAMQTARDWREVECMTGIPEAQYRAHRCYLVYGLPELEPIALARWIAGASDRRTSSTTTTTTAPTISHEPTYGFTTRKD